MKHEVIPFHFCSLARRTAGLLLAVLFLLLFGVAYAVPVEPLHLKGIQDGGDYDSLIQPLVLALAGVPDTPVPVLTPLGPSPAWVTSSVSAELPAPARRAAEPRAPPVL
jgi:hypothetical protein